MALTAKQEAFCVAYVETKCATQAAVKAGYSQRGARVEGHRLLTNANICERITQIQQEIEGFPGVSGLIETALQMSKIKDANISDFVEIREGGLTIKDTDSIPKDMWKMVRKVAETRHGISIELHDPLKAAEILNKMLGYYEKDNNQKHPKQNAIERMLDDMTETELKDLLKN